MDEKRTHCIGGSVQMAVNKKTNPQILCCRRQHTLTPTHADKAGKIVCCFLNSGTVSQFVFPLSAVNRGLPILIKFGRGFMVSWVKTHLIQWKKWSFVLKLEDVSIGSGASPKEPPKDPPPTKLYSALMNYGFHSVRLLVLCCKLIYACVS